MQPRQDLPGSPRSRFSFPIGTATACSHDAHTPFTLRRKPPPSYQLHAPEPLSEVPTRLALILQNLVPHRKFSSREMQLLQHFPPKRYAEMEMHVILRAWA